MSTTYLITARVEFRNPKDESQGPEDASQELWEEFTRWLDRELRGVETFEVSVGPELAHS